MPLYMLSDFKKIPNIFKIYCQYKLSVGGKRLNAFRLVTFGFNVIKQQHSFFFFKVTKQKRNQIVKSDSFFQPEYFLSDKLNSDSTDSPHNSL